MRKHIDMPDTVKELASRVQRVEDKLKSSKSASKGVSSDELVSLKSQIDEIGSTIKYSNKDLKLELNRVKS